MDRERIIAGLNYWMDDYIDRPQEYTADFETVMKHLQERNEGREPSYGEIGLALMEELIEKHAND